MPRIALRFGAVLGAATIAVATLGSPAWAHTELTASDPAEGSTVTSATTTLTLTFSEPVSAQDTTVAVLGPDGASLSTGAVRTDGNKALQDVRALPVGAIRVQWRTVSLDGDPVRGEFGFTNAYVAPTPTQPATTPAPAPATASAVTASPAAAGGVTGGVPGWLVAVAALVVVAAAGAGLMYWRHARR
jgi:copper resistance protein C